MSRSAAQNEILITKVRQVGELPGFLGVIQRHFEKSRPLVVNEEEASLNANVDFLDMILPMAILREIDSLTICYKKRVG